MSFANFEIRDPSEQEIQDYWKWLLSADPDGNNTKGGVYYMRAALNYTHAIQDLLHPKRVNLSGGRANSVGQPNPVRIPSNVKVFLPIMDTMANDNYLNPSGNQLTISEMNNVLVNENRQIKPEDLNATIERLEGHIGPVSIVPRINNILYSPSQPNDTFELTIPRDSTFAEKMEFIIPKETTINARVAGLYVVVDKISPGTYHITNDSIGVRGYRSAMDYYIEAY